jgi:hypothetical protein
VPQIVLNDEEAEIVREVIEARLRELRREISHTDSPRFRETLYRVDATLDHLLAQLPHQIPLQG